MNDGGASCFGDNQANALGSNHNYDTGALISSATPLAVYGYAAGDTYPAPTYSPDTGFRIIQGPLSAIVTVGSAKTLTAYFDSSLMPAGSIVPTTASWSLNGTPLRTTPIARGSTGPLATSLVLTDLTEKDMGVYQVTVNYTGGQLTDFASLQTAY
jgi:hypothetical protein